jgi:chemotaxis protein histidine kinase CheA
MTHAPESKKLLDRISVRLRLTAIGRTSLRAFWIAGALYAVAFVCSRFFGLFPDYFEMVTLTVIPGAALILGILFHRRPSTSDAARRVDKHEKTRDLYLTVTMLDTTAGEYQPLVQRDAEEKAQSVNASRVVPFRCDNRTWSWATALLVVLFLGLQFGPQLDPFGRVEAATIAKQLQEEMKKSKEVTEVRTAELAKKQKDDNGEVSKEVKQSLEKLVRSLQEMKKNQKKANQKTLAKEQKRIGAQWRNVRNSDPMKELLNRKAAAQSFGKNLRQMREWSKELEEGKSESLNKMMEELRKQMEELKKDAAEGGKMDPVKKQEAFQKLKKKLKEMEDFAKKNVKSEALAAALQRAMKQLEASKDGDKKSAAEALEAAMKSLDLSKMELQEIAKSAKDMKELEQALKTMQMAKKLNEQGELTGEAGESPTMEDYAEMYAEMYAELGFGEGDGDGDGDGKGNGDGTGGEGMGRGGNPPEDENVKTNFKKEKSKAAVTAGKIILSMKTKGLSETGETNEEYQKLIQEVKQGVSEAIDLEEIPPGYIPNIKSYFDKIEKAEPGAAAAESGGNQQPETVDEKK